MPSRAKVMLLITLAKVRDRFCTLFSNQMASTGAITSHRLCINDESVISLESSSR